MKTLQKSYMLIMVSIFLLVMLIGLYFLFNKHSDDKRDIITIAPISVAGDYVQEIGDEFENSIKITQVGNNISFSGLAVYPVYQSDENDEAVLVTVNTGELNGTTTIVGNKARWINTEWQSEGQDSCIIDFTFNADGTLAVDTSDGSVIACGWGMNVGFEGLYQKK